MDTVLMVGDHVLVRTFSGAEVERIVVGETDEGPLIATLEEYQAAQSASREAQGVGWPAEFIVGKVERANGQG